MEKLQDKLNYHFKNIEYLTVALTHSSYTKENNLPRNMCNERLEFLGDAVLELIVCENLFKSLPDDREGRLTKAKSDIVRTESLATIARSIDLGKYLRLGNGEIIAKAYNRDTTLENAMEAIIGAVFLEVGFEGAKKIILPLFEEQIEKAKEGKLLRDYKTVFQEYVQRQGTRDIEYIIVDEYGMAHDKTFFAELKLDGKVVGKGNGKSKKVAETNAAKDAIESYKDKEK